MTSPLRQSAVEVCRILSPDNVPPIDLAALRRRASDDDELMREVIGDFLATSDELVASVVMAVEVRDFRAVAVHAHRIRGALLALSADHAASAAGEVEQLAGRLGAATEGVSAEPLAPVVRVFVEAVECVCLEMCRFLAI